MIYSNNICKILLAVVPLAMMAAARNSHVILDTLVQDLSWPEEHCCRLYRNPQFLVRDPEVWGDEYDYEDFCTSDDERVEDLSDTYLNDQV